MLLTTNIPKLLGKFGNLDHTIVNSIVMKPGKDVWPALKSLSARKVESTCQDARPMKCDRHVLIDIKFSSLLTVTCLIAGVGTLQNTSISFGQF